jgi:hypothetical protein
MPDTITIDQLSSRLDDALGELKKVRELREREEQARLAAKPSPVSVDATVPATAADPDEKLYEERVREAQARSPAGLPPKDKFSFVRFFRAQMAHNPALAPYEMRCFAASQKKFDSLHERRPSAGLRVRPAATGSARSSCPRSSWRTFARRSYARRRACGSSRARALRCRSR